MSKKRGGSAPTAMKELDDESRSLSSWKFDLMEVMNADPVFKGSHCKVVEAYLHFVTPARSAYLSIVGLKVRTGLSQPTITECIKDLQRHGVFTPTGKTPAGVVWFKIQNAREALVMEHMQLRQEYLHEADARRKAAERERRKAGSVRKESLVAKRACPQENLGDVSKISYDKHLEGTPGYPDSTERRARSHASRSAAYLLATRGG